MEKQSQPLNRVERKRKISNHHSLRSVKMKMHHHINNLEFQINARSAEVDNCSEGNPMIGMLLPIVLWLDMIICSAGKNKDEMIYMIILSGLQWGVNNNNIKNQLLEIICEPTRPANYLKMICYGGIVVLLFYYHLSEHKSSIAQRLYGVAALASIAHLLWTFISVVPVSYQLCFLLCTICLAFLCSVVKDGNLKILSPKLLFGMWLGLMVVLKYYSSLSELPSSIGLLLLEIVAVLFSIGYHLCITHFALPISYLLSLLRIIGWLNLMLCSVGKNAERMNRYLKFLEFKALFDFRKLFEMLRDCRGPADHLKVVCCFGGSVIFVCCLGMLNHPSIDHRFLGVVFLSSLGHNFWTFSTPLPFWSRVCFVCGSDLLLAGLATTYEYYFNT